MERALRKTRELDPAAEDFKRLERELSNTAKAIAGLRAAGRAEKLRNFEEKQSRLQLQEAELLQKSPTRREVLRLQAQFDELSQDLKKAQAELEELHRQGGRRSSRAGSSFEDEAVECSRTHLLAEVGADTILTGVTLGAARLEFDQLLLAGTQVKAAVEAKRNPNDLARGYRHRCDNLAWLRGEARAEPNSAFPSGWFERAVHEQDGRTYQLQKTSFQGVQEPYLISRPRRLWGLDAKALSRIAWRVSTRTQDDESLWRWCLTLAGPFETPDLLERCAPILLTTGT